ncbi:DsbA family protein [Dyadobacter luticola]|uniref:DsbA family protein n=2 Tax=Dyadobacter luticola TaxID=1979387 RepID=A0A5R9L6G1_9BACT|nr:DsbA family protein [Dyadobacter luticola]
MQSDKPVKVTYFTDPICSTCWGIEPQLRKLKLEYGDYLDIDYRMGGLLPDWNYNSGGISKPSDVGPHWDEVSAHYQMPIDGDVWLEDPLHSSFPPSVAVKAAALQDEIKAATFMRKLREAVFLEKKNITRWEVISEAAAAVGLDVDQLKTDFEGLGNDLFEEDLALAKELGVRGFPTMLFTDQDSNQLKVYGFKPYETFENALLAIYPDAVKKPVNLTSDISLFEHYPTLTPKEFATITAISFEEAEEQLDKLFEQNLVDKLTIKNGSVYRLK